MSEEGNGINLEERVHNLEKRLSEIDALVKGLTDEVLDMKAVVLKLKKDQRPPPVIQAVVPPVSRGKVERESVFTSSEDVKPQVPIQARDKITLKMQPDGTLLPERDTGEDIIVASARDARMRSKDGHARSGQNDLIIAEDKEPSNDS